jgi:hypothetical protein
LSRLTPHILAKNQRERKKNLKRKRKQRAAKKKALVKKATPAQQHNFKKASRAKIAPAPRQNPPLHLLQHTNNKKTLISPPHRQSHLKTRQQSKGHQSHHLKT